MKTKRSLLVIEVVEVGGEVLVVEMAQIGALEVEEIQTEEVFGVEVDRIEDVADLTEEVLVAEVVMVEATEVEAVMVEASEVEEVTEVATEVEVEEVVIGEDLEVEDVVGGIKMGVGTMVEILVKISLLAGTKRVGTRAGMVEQVEVLIKELYLLLGIS